MIQYIEGMMCAGKTTLVQKLKEQGKLIAPEPTPPPLSNTPVLEERQNAIFNSYVDHFEKYINLDETYICDYSPFGVIPFEKALARFMNSRNEPETALTLNNLAKVHNYILQEKAKIWGNRCIKIKYLPISTDEVLNRLALRNREGDNQWDSVLVDFINEEYKNYFEQ